MDDSSDRLSFLGRPVPRGFELRVVTLSPGSQLPYAEAEWEDSLVVVERGRVDLECMAGGRRRFRPGDLIWLVGLRLRAVHNPADEPAVLVAIRRRTATDEFSIPAGSELA
jgi:quercetin dioxygenase-like cupin family protein